ncbi:MAG: mechanosensitive ion channel family protein [Phycisphaerae bacterium]|nr:mechanosensitive ion channel family protein [Phycisphaerae bacterium]
MPASTWLTIFTENRFLGNALWQWLALLGVILAAMISGKIVSLVLQHWTKRLEEMPDRFIVTGMFARSFLGPIMLFSLAVGLYVSSFFLTFAPSTEADVWGPKEHWLRACATLVVIAAAWTLYRLVAVVEHLLRRVTRRSESSLDNQLVPLVRKTLRVFVVIVAAVFIAQTVYEWDIGAVLAGLGIGGLAFALAAKDMLANFFGSATIFADRPFRMGDRILFKGYDGIVEEVGFRTTRLRLLDGNLVTLPNALVANEPIENISRRPSIKRTLNVTVTYDTQPEKLQRGVDILLAMLEARKASFPADTPPRVYFSDFNADSLNIVVYYWFSPADWWEYLEFNHDFNMELLRRYNEEGIEFAFPTQTLYMKKES